MTGRKRQRVSHELKVPKAAAHEGKGQHRKRLDLSPEADPSDGHDELMGSDADYDEVSNGHLPGVWRGTGWQRWLRLVS